MQNEKGGQRLPCIMHWPDRIEAGETCDAVVTSMDFFPTFSNIAGVPIPGDRKIDGYDISALMFNAKATAPNDTFYY